MRKRTINNIYDKILYGLMYIVPLVIMCISYFNNGDITFFNDFISNTGIASNVFTTNFNKLMIDYLHFFEDNNNVLLKVFDYMLIITMLHLVFDIFDYVPKLIRAIMKKAGVNDDE